MTIHIAADHAGYEHKEAIKAWLLSLGHEIVDHGAQHFDKDDDFVDFMFPAARAVAADNSSKGVIFGGSGQGEAMAANRIKGVRAVVYYGARIPLGAVDSSGRISEDEDEILRLSRQHNNANVLSIGARFVSTDEAMRVIALWLEESFSGQERYAKRNRELDNR